MIRFIYDEKHPVRFFFSQKTTNSEASLNFWLDCFKTYYGKTLVVHELSNKEFSKWFNNNYKYRPIYRDEYNILQCCDKLYEYVVNNV